MQASFEGRRRIQSEMIVDRSRQKFVARNIASI